MDRGAGHDLPTPRTRAVWTAARGLMLAMLAIQAGLTVAGWLGERLRGALGLPPGPAGPVDLLFALLSVAGAGSAYLLYVWLVERRRAAELAVAGAGRELALGALLGGGLMAVCIGVLWALGAYRVTGVISPLVLVSALATALFRGFVEELLVRGVGLRVGRELLGTWPALLLSAIIFGLLHARNPGASIGSTLGVTAGGLLLGAAFVATGRLWLAAGLHSAWNFVQGGIFGLAVSGGPSGGVLRSELVGPSLLTGGAFGVEASPLATLVCLIAASALLQRERRERAAHAEPGSRRGAPAEG